MKKKKEYKPNLGIIYSAAIQDHIIKKSNLGLAPKKLNTETKLPKI